MAGQNQANLTYRDDFDSFRDDFRHNLLAKQGMASVDPCCVHGCALPGCFRVSTKQLRHAQETAAAEQQGRPGFSDISGFDLPATGPPGVCGTHAFNVIKSHVDGEGGPVHQATAKPRFGERSYISGVIKIANKAVKEQAPLGNRTGDAEDESEEDRTRRRSKTQPSRGSAKRKHDAPQQPALPKRGSARTKPK